MSAPPSPPIRAPSNERDERGHRDTAARHAVRPGGKHPGRDRLASLAPRLLLPFVAAVLLSAATTIVAMISLGPDAGLDTTWMLLAVAAVVAAFPVRVPTLRIDATAVHPFVFAALVLSGPIAAALIDVAGVIVSAFGRRRRPVPMHFAFNVAAVVLSVGAAWWVFLALDGVLDSPPELVVAPLIGAALAYFAVNAGLVSVAISLEKHRPLAVTLRRSCLWTALPFFSGITVAFALVSIKDMLMPWGIVLALPPCWLIISLYRLHSDRTESSA